MISSQASDVRLPSLDDFPTDHPDNHIFIQKTKLCIALGRLADVRQSSRATRADVVPVGEALRKWQSELPSHLKLDDHPGQQPYRRLVSELHIMYHVCSIIYLQTLSELDTDLRSARGAFKECVQHSLMIVRNLEPVLYRNEVSYLRPMNNWFCLVAGIILVRALATGTEVVAAYDKELQVLKNVLQDMVATSPTSALILRNLIGRESAVGTAPEWSTIASGDATTGRHSRLTGGDVCLEAPEPAPGVHERPSVGTRSEPVDNTASAVLNPGDEYFLTETFDLDYASFPFNSSLPDDWSLPSLL